MLKKALVDLMEKESLSMTRKQNTYDVRRLTVSALLLSLSLAVKTFTSFYIPMFGQNGMSVGISGVFSMLPALLYGPVYGAAVSALSDLIGHFLKPAGAYMPLLTLTAALGGFLRGLVWQGLKKVNPKKLTAVLAALSLILVISGAANALMLDADGIVPGFWEKALENGVESADESGMHAVSRLIVSRTRNMKNPAKGLQTYRVFLTAAVSASGGLGLLLLSAEWLLQRKIKKAGGRDVPRLLAALMVSGLAVTTLNTLILRETVFTAWKVLPFSAVWIPRVVEETMSNAVKAYFVLILMDLLTKSFRRAA